MKHLKKLMEEIVEQREEILKAFISKYDCQPNECEQIVEYNGNTMIFYVRKRKDNEMS
jgi:hypothetical protein